MCTLIGAIIAVILAVLCITNTLNTDQLHVLAWAIIAFAGGVIIDHIRN